MGLVWGSFPMNRFLYALIVVVMAATTVFAVLAWSVHSVVR